MKCASNRSVAAVTGAFDVQGNQVLILEIMIMNRSASAAARVHFSILRRNAV